MSEAAARPVVTVFDAANGKASGKTVSLPGVMTAPIRPDVVTFVHTNIAKNRRQAYCVKENAGMDTAAESWGTGRAVSRIPRVPGGGTHRAGQGAFGNMCRGGRMFNPTRIWRKWHRKVNKNQRRYAICSALAASAIPALVMARGHNVDKVPEMPLVIGGDALGQVKKTKEAVALLNKFGCQDDLNRVSNSKHIRAGKGKMRNRRYTKRRGPLVIHASTSADLPKALRNIEGVDLCHIDRLNILSLAPGGHLGRFIVWTQDAFEKLDALYGTQSTKATLKNNYRLPTTGVTNADIDRIINSEEIQKVCRDAKDQKSTKTLRKKNALRNRGVKIKLNPYALAHLRAEKQAVEQRKQRTEKVKKARNTKAERKAFYEKMIS